jgi:hypothetical protein
MRQLILSKLSPCDLARAAVTCQEFQQAYVTWVVEERARLVALGKETYGEGRFCGMVRAIQRAMCGLDPCPRAGFGPWDWRDAFIDGAGDPHIGFLDVWENGPTASIWKPSAAFGSVTACARAAGGRASYVQLDMSGDPLGDVHLTVQLWKNGPGAALGLLLAICTEDPAAMSPRIQACVTMQLTMLFLASGAQGRREAEEAIGPSGLLVHLFTIYPPPHPGTPLGEEISDAPRGVLARVTFAW